jgi:hypothetical protein
MAPSALCLKRQHREPSAALRVDAMGARPSSLHLELTCNFLERGPFRRHAVPACVDDVQNVTADETGGRKRGPYILIRTKECYNTTRKRTERIMQDMTPIQDEMTDGVVTHEWPRQGSHVEDPPAANGKRVDVHLWRQYLGAFHQLGRLPT